MCSHRFTVVFWGVVVFFLALCYEIDCACENRVENVIIKLKYDPNCNARVAFYFTFGKQSLVLKPLAREMVRGEIIFLLLLLLPFFRRLSSSKVNI